MHEKIKFLGTQPVSNEKFSPSSTKEARAGAMPSTTRPQVHKSAALHVRNSELHRRPTPTGTEPRTVIQPGSRSPQQLSVTRLAWLAGKDDNARATNPIRPGARLPVPVSHSTLTAEPVSRAPRVHRSFSARSVPDATKRARDPGERPTRTCRCATALPPARCLATPPRRRAAPRRGVATVRPRGARGGTPASARA
jgi:hypothetical protein